MTGPAPEIGEGATCYWQKPPAVVAGTKRKLQDTERSIVTDLARRERCPKRLMACATRPDDELSNSAQRIWMPLRIQSGETFVNVVVTDDEELGARVVKVFPERLHFDHPALKPRTPPRMMPDGKAAQGWVLRHLGT